MSCHDIGRALNNVEEKILELYEQKKLDKEIVRELLICCTKSVHYCDGNEYEATETFDEEYCSMCVEKLNEGDILYDLYATVGYERYSELEVLAKKHRLVGRKLCEKCFNVFMQGLNMSVEDIEKEKERQVEDEDAVVVYYE